MNSFDLANASKSSGRKEDKDCTVCNDFQDFMKGKATTKKPSAKTDAANEVDANENVECPLYRNQMGRMAWSYLHTMAAYYPKEPSEQEQTSMKTFIETFAQFFPCNECASDFKDE